MDILCAHSAIESATTAVVTVAPEATMLQACLLLARHRVSALPVCSRAGVLATVTYADLNAFLLLAVHSAPTEIGTLELIRGAVVKACGQACVADVIAIQSIPTVSKECSLMDAVNACVNRKVHRLLLVDRETNDIAGIISQSNIARFVAEWYLKPNSRENDLWAKNVGLKSLKELQLVNRNVPSVGANDRVIDALSIMHLQGITSIAIKASSEDNNVLTT